MTAVVREDETLNMLSARLGVPGCMLLRCNGLYSPAWLLPGREIPLVDEERYLTYFLEGGTVESFLGDETIWGEDLTQYPGLLHTVAGHIATLEGGGSLL